MQRFQGTERRKRTMKKLIGRFCAMYALARPSDNLTLHATFSGPSQNPEAEWANRYTFFHIGRWGKKGAIRNVNKDEVRRLMINEGTSLNKKIPLHIQFRKQKDEKDIQGLMRLDL